MRPLFIILLVFLVISCKKKNNTAPSDPYEHVDQDFNTDLLNDEVTVYFAQTHVQEPTLEKYGRAQVYPADKFKLIGNREALIKVHLTGKKEIRLVPRIGLKLELDGKSAVLPMTKPEKIDTYFEKALGKVEHKLDDNFNAMIPKKWIKPGLKVTILIGREEKIIENINVGAPTKIRVNLFHINLFREGVALDFSQEWIDEFRAKFPFSEFEINLIPARFPEMTYPGNQDTPDIRVSSKKQYHDHLGATWFDYSGAVWGWLWALNQASGTYLQKEVTLIPLPSGGGKANGNYIGRYNGNNTAILLHEMGHVFSLQHWADGVWGRGRYPYLGDMHGISAPTQNAHVGPIWGFDLRTKTFIPPTVQENAVGGVKGEYKQDPMAGGGSGTQENIFRFNHFSNYSARNMQTYAEKKTAVWNNSLRSYATWSDETKDYTDLLESNGVNLPIARDLQVYSVLTTLSKATPQAHIVYPPIGPYKSGITKVFDPRKASDRSEAQTIYCPDLGCDATIKVIQGGTTNYYMLPIDHDPDVTILNESISNKAINLKASDGEITKVELLYTPNAETNGLPDRPNVLYTWEQ